MSFFNHPSNKDEQTINYKKVNEVVSLSKNILKILYIILITLGIYLITRLGKEWKILDFILTILNVVSPLFIGLLVAWLFNPLVKWLKEKGLSRLWGSVITYILFLTFVGIILGTLIPLLSNQINDFAASIPGIFETMEDWSNGVFNSLSNIKNLDVESIKGDFYKSINEFGTSLTTALPGMTVNFVKGFLSSIVNILVGLVIGFYILVSYDGNEALITLLPKGARNTTRDLLNEVEQSLRSFIQGALLDSTFVFIITSLCLWLVGLKAPLLFGFFCGLTNMIPYAGPYIGGAPAVIVGFSQNPTTGLFTLLVIAIIQILEGNFIQPLIMSKTTNLHPVTIMLGLLIFGHFWGIIGMFISTPIIASVKAIAIFLNNKHKFITFDTKAVMEDE